jgi:hypothetical protein
MKVLSPGKIKKQISVTTAISASLFLIPIITIIFFSSCTKSNKFSIGEDFVESQTNLKIIDTFKVDLSTILLDSLPTSGKGVALVGSYKDDEFGAINCASYFDVAFPTFSEIEDGAIFDSASFILGYSGYSFGDTTSLMSISIRQLTERITLNDNGYLYNNSTFDFSPDALRTKLFFPAPKSSDTVVCIPVNKFGEELFMLIKSRNNIVTTEDLFLDYMKGFVLTSDVGESNAVIGFLADANHVILRIYYHLEKLTPEDKEISITMGDAGNQFNSIQHDFTGTYLNKLNADNNEFLSTETGNKAFMQALTGLMPKIQFPTLQDIMLENRWKILKAELIIEPVKTSYDFFALPEEIYLYETDKHNNINGTLHDNSGKAVVASFVLDELYKEDTRYTFDITNFIINELSDKYVDYEHGLLIGLLESKYKSTLERLVVEDKNPPIKLKLYYLTY